jgi:hypothetical protein
VSGAQGCPARRRLVFHVSGARRGRVVRVVAYVDGKRVKSVRARRISRVILRSPARSRFAVRLVAYMSTNRRFTTTYRYRACRHVSTRRIFNVR